MSETHPHQQSAPKASVCFSTRDERGSLQRPVRERERPLRERRRAPLRSAGALRETRLHRIDVSVAEGAFREARRTTQLPAPVRERNLNKWVKLRSSMS
jgi:hypothetical protein